MSTTDKKEELTTEDRERIEKYATKFLLKGSQHTARLTAEHFILEERERSRSIQTDKENLFDKIGELINEDNQLQQGQSVLDFIREMKQENKDLRKLNDQLLEVEKQQPAQQPGEPQV